MRGGSGGKCCGDLGERDNPFDADLKAVRDAGYTDANVMEIVALVAMYSLTSFFNNVFDPEKDFPAVTPAGSI
jgi:hypothetical protein